MQNRYFEHTLVNVKYQFTKRNSLVIQAKRSFANLLPDLSVTNLCEEKDNYQAHCVFSTYQTMMNCIDSVKDEEGKLFTCGHIDLDKEMYEDTFKDENGEILESASFSALKAWLFNEYTIKKALHILMKDGIKINCGEKLGKTIYLQRIMHMQKRF